MKNYVEVECEFTLIETECHSWMIICKPKVPITEQGFYDSLRTYLLDKTGMDESGPPPGTQLT